MDAENSQHPTDAVSSTVEFANLKTWRVKIAVRRVAAGLLAVALFAVALLAFATQSGEQADPLSPTEQILVGTWTVPAQAAGSIPEITFHADRTVEYLGVNFKYPTRWRIVDSSLIIQYKYQTMIGPLPLPMPVAVTNFELPSFMARKENVIHSVAFSEDGRTMTLVPGGGPLSFDFVRSAAENDTKSEHHTNE